MSRAPRLRRRLTNPLGRTVLLIVLDRDHVTQGATAARRRRRAAAHARGRDVNLPVRRAVAGAGPGSALAIWRRSDATTSAADVAGRAFVVGGAGQHIRRTLISGAERHAGFSCVTADLVLIAVVDHHLEAI